MNPVVTASVEAKCYCFREKLRIFFFGSVDVPVISSF